MPGRVGHISRIIPEPGVEAAIDAAKDLDELKDVLKNVFREGFRGRVRAHNDRTGEDWAGGFIVMSGGMIVFDNKNELGSFVGAYDANVEDGDEFTELDDGAANFMPRRKDKEESEPVRTGRNK